MTLTITHDLSHLPAAEASRKASADADATLETADQGRAAAAERLSSAVSKLRKGDTTVTATQLGNMKVDVERHGYIHSGAASAAHGAKNAIVNVDTSIAEAMAFYLQGDSHPAKFPLNAVVGVNPPTAELIDPPAGRPEGIRHEPAGHGDGRAGGHRRLPRPLPDRTLVPDGQVRPAGTADLPPRPRRDRSAPHSRVRRVGRGPRAASRDRGQPQEARPDPTAPTHP